MNKTEPPVLISNSEVHGLSNGKMDEWSKVKYGKIEFLKKYQEAEKAVKNLKDD